MELVIIKDLVDHGREVTTGVMGTSALITAVQAGDIDIWSSVASETLMDPYRAGHVRPLVTLDDKRFDGLPDVPMLSEMGMPAQWKDVGAIRMWFAPIGTNADVIQGVGTRIAKLLDDPQIKDWARKGGFVHELASGAEAKASQEGLYKLLKDNDDIYKKYGG